MDTKHHTTSTENLHSLEADHKSRTAFTYSSTPKPLPVKRTSPLDASVPLFPTTSLSPELLEDSDFEQHKWMRSKSFLASRALPSFGAFPSRHLHRLSDLKETSKTSIPKRITPEYCSAVRQVRKMSPFQADYWACAIPDSLPPSPDRQSPHWDPNKEYEDLLDYTYPIRPKYKLAKSLQYGTHDSSIHDSGIGLDSLSISPESTLKATVVPGQEHRITGVQTAQRFQTPSMKKPEHSFPVSYYGFSPTGKVSFADGGPSIDRTTFSRERAQGLHPRCIGFGSSDSTNREKQYWNAREHNCITEDANKHDCILRRVANGGFIRSTRVLPLQNECGSDEEYLPLPPRLKELERLAQQLTDLSLTIRKPGHSHLEDGFPSIRVNGDSPPTKVPGRDGNQWEADCDSFHTSGSQECSEEDLLSNQSYEDCLNTHRDITNTGTSDFVGTECFSGGRECRKEGEYHHEDSLAQRIQIFCCRLEELIRWLHRIAEITDNWVPPKPDVESVKASLQTYLAFKKDLASNQMLTDGVLEEGEKLLKNMASSSPVLQQTLGLISRQSSELESNAERLYQSIVGALDTLDAGLRKGCDTQQPAGPSEASKRLMSATL